MEVKEQVKDKAEKVETWLNKIKKFPESKFFWFGYMILFGLGLCLILATDLIPVKVLEDGKYSFQHQCYFPWFRGMLRAVACVHFAGGLCFFTRFVFKQLNWSL